MGAVKQGRSYTNCGEFERSAAANAYDLNTIVKMVINECVQPLIGIFNKRVEEEIFPDELKIAEIVAVRTMSIFKILQKIITICLPNYFEKFNLLNNSQHEVRTRRFTTVTLADAGMR